VEGVSGRGPGVSAEFDSGISVLGPCCSGNSTSSTDNREGFFFRRARLAGHERSGLDNQGSYSKIRMQQFVHEEKGDDSLGL
jgi:hypothetical protein